ncbi:tRNA uracil 4-sulfurtransferase ThiI [Streptomyces caatingaensis]|uniref:Probable tRNA sulfurtransferase n=1 Tax=Streptomyces caatingaensis TaxID=1678637 RepID=A0A0K9XIU3_9ACTN|nr:tRNA uracil 4-sulfurtransferase ThiI [Streptomyces caatingaensis]KNB53208.1 thiamine biosynthesis protein ThiI [Streptomyces caatingaensis]
MPRQQPKAPAGGASRPSGPAPCVLLKPGEAFLKGRNRDRFEQRLHDNLRYALRGVGGSTWIKSSQNVTVLGGQVPVGELVERARRVIGFSAVEPAVRVPSTVEDIAATVLDALDGLRARRPGLTFAVRARRRDKDFSLTSTELERYVGGVVHGTLGLPVDLRDPDVRVSVEVGRHETYVSWERHKGQGGLPVGTSGRALVLLSGGYDSPVAGYRAMRRGLRCDFVHFTGAPYTNAASVYKAYALARELNRYQPAGRLHVIALGTAQKQLAIAGAGKYQVVAQRRLMVRAASALARRTGAEALVTGDSLGQVASQTLTNLATIDEAATLPVLRPLLGWEKQEIIDEARAIGTAPVSVLPDEDCCKLLAPGHVSTRAQLPDVQRVEKRLDMDEVIEGLLRAAQCLRPGADDAGGGDATGLPAAAGPVCGA